MKLSFSLKSKEARLEVDVEKLIEKGMDQKAKNPPKKSRYEIKQEEKRKNAELKHKQNLQISNSPKQTSASGANAISLTSANTRNSCAPN